MPQSLSDLEKQRSSLASQLVQLGDLRPGSVTGIVRRCGKPTCHCAQPDDPGHGPTLRLTYKVQGKTISETLPGPASVRKAEREIAEFRRFQELSRSFLEVNEKICRLRPVEEQALSEQEKNGGRHPTGSRARSRAIAAHHLHWRAQDRQPGSGSRRDAGALGHASGGSEYVDRATQKKFPDHRRISERFHAPAGSKRFIASYAPRCC